MKTVVWTILMSLFLPLVGQASVIEIPGADSTKSGIDIFSGWKCTATGPITVRFDGGAPITIPYGSERNDTMGICGDADNGYALLLNYNTLGPGTHTAEVFDNGVSFASVTFTVVTTGVEFLAGVSGTGTVTLSNGQVLTLAWSEAVQGFEITAVTGPSMMQGGVVEVANAANEIPGTGTKIGVGILSGWHCNATTLTARFNGGPMINVPYGSQRNDTLSICGHANTGYVLLLNYSILGPGMHTVEIFADGILVETVMFEVITLGVEFLTGVTGTGMVTLSNGVEATVQWSQAKQGVEITAFSSDYTGTWNANLGVDFDTCGILPPFFGGVTLPASVDVAQTGSSITIMVDVLDLTLMGTVNPDGSFMVTSPPTESELDAMCSATSTGSATGNFETEMVSVSISLSDPMGTCTDFTIPCSAMLSGTLMMADDGMPAP